MSRSSATPTSHRFSPAAVPPASPARSATAAFAPSSPAPSKTSTRSAASFTAREVKPEDLAEWEDEVLKSGAHKDMRFGVVRSVDRRRCGYIVQKCNDGGLRDPSLIEFARYLIDADRAQGDQTLMAVQGEGLPEDSMLAVIDTGCNSTCHGSRWFDSYQKVGHPSGGDLWQLHGCWWKDRGEGTTTNPCCRPAEGWWRRTWNNCINRIGRK